LEKININSGRTIKIKMVIIPLSRGGNSGWATEKVKILLVVDR
jgi:hypothetical protein